MEAVGMAVARFFMAIWKMFDGFKKRNGNGGQQIPLGTDPNSSAQRQVSMLESLNQFKEEFAGIILAKAQSKMRGSSTQTDANRDGTCTMSAGWKITWSDAHEKWISYSGQNTVTIAFHGSYFLNANGAIGLTIEGLTFSSPSAGTYPGGIYLKVHQGTSFAGTQSRLSLIHI